MNHANLPNFSTSSKSSKSWEFLISKVPFSFPPRVQTESKKKKKSYPGIRTEYWMNIRGPKYL